MAMQGSDFMRYFNSNLARELGRLHHWTDKIWSRRYQAIVISAEESEQVKRLRYVLSHGVKEGLCERASDWPGVSCVRALIAGETELTGHWFDRTQEYAARRRGEDFDRMRFAILEVLKLSPLPCWRHLPEETRKKLIAALVAEIELEAAARRESTGSQVLGVSAILGQHPHDRPARSKKSPAPMFHAATRAVHRELYAAYAWFVASYREAAEKLRAGNREALFPAGSFPPALPFVAAAG